MNEAAVAKRGVSGRVAKWRALPPNLLRAASVNSSVATRQSNFVPTHTHIHTHIHLPIYTNTSCASECSFVACRRLPSTCSE